MCEGCALQMVRHEKSRHFFLSYCKREEFFPVTGCLSSGANCQSGLSPASSSHLTLLSASLCPTFLLSFLHPEKKHLILGKVPVTMMSLSFWKVLEERLLRTKKKRHFLEETKSCNVNLSIPPYPTLPHSFYGTHLSNNKYK